MNADESVIKCRLDPCDYTMNIIAGDAIPFEQITVHEINVEVYINNRFLQKIIYSKESGPGINKVVIPGKYIKKGYNLISFKSDMWSPAEYGSEDHSHYGVSVSRIELVKE